MKQNDRQDRDRPQPVDVGAVGQRSSVDVIPNRAPLNRVLSANSPARAGLGRNHLRHPAGYSISWLRGTGAGPGAEAPALSGASPSRQSRIARQSGAAGTDLPAIILFPLTWALLIQFSGVWLWPTEIANPLDADSAKPFGVAFNLIVYALILGLLALHVQRAGAENLLRALMPFAPLFAWSLACGVLGLQPGASLRALILWALTLTGGALVGLNLQKRSFETCLLLFAVGALWLSAAWAIANPSGGVVMGYWRGVFLQKNFLGWFAAIALVMLLAFPSQSRRLLSIAAASGALTCLLMSGSRTSLMVVLSCAAMRTVLRIPHRSVGTRLSAVVLLIATCVLVPVFGLELILELLGKDPTLTGRTVIWGMYMEQALERPVFGFGPSTFLGVSEITQKFNESLVEYGDIRHPHNVFIAYAGETGLVGGFLFVALLARFAVFEAARRPLAVALLPALVSFAIAVEGMAESLVGYGTNLGWFVLSAAVAQGLARNRPGPRPARLRRIARVSSV